MPLGLCCIHKSVNTCLGKSVPYLGKEYSWVIKGINKVVVQCSTASLALKVKFATVDGCKKMQKHTPLYIYPDYEYNS